MPRKRHPSYVPVTAAGRLERAFLAKNLGYYKLGAGGRDPSAPLPFTGRQQADCSGLAAWLCGYDRFQPCTEAEAPKGAWDDGNKGFWIETTNIIADATRPKNARWFRVVPRSEKVQPGDFLVYGDLKGKQGHIGMVAAVLDGFEEARASRKDWGNLLHIIDCSPRGVYYSRRKRYKRDHAVQFRPDNAQCWYDSGRAYFVRPIFAPVVDPATGVNV